MTFLLKKPTKEKNIKEKKKKYAKMASAFVLIFSTTNT